METINKTLITTWVANQPINLEYTNTILINLRNVMIDEFTEDERESVTRLKPHSGFTSHHLSELLRMTEIPSDLHLGNHIAHDISHQLANDHSLREPLSVIVRVMHIIKVRPLLLPHVSPPRGALPEVLQRLAEEQRVETQCSICLEYFSKSHGYVTALPECKHRFHETCLFEWLRRQNSCPLCRTVPYEDDIKK